ncbi:MAG TPA: FAD-dependent monooxygenase [Xanthobacteraceae bacterium]|jgi:salicylate hydroxylase|nr:FAD-dependent monooxygenase [Xanthobacteraceae bacterium]
MRGNEPILVVGGGLGGLTTALALARRGRSVRVLEGAGEFGAIGYGIQFGPNVFHALERLGLMDEVLAVGDTPKACLLMDAVTGKELVRIPTGASLRARFKYPYLIIHRIDLHNVLLDACRRSDAIELVSDAMVTGFEDRGDSVAVATADGRTFSGPAVIAADGFRSLFRAELAGDGEPRPIGYVALRTIVPMDQLKADVPRDCVLLWGGPGLHIVHYPLRHGTQFNLVNVYRTPAHAERLDEAAARAELHHAYRGMHPSMLEMIEMTDLRWRRSIGDRDPIRHWHKGRVVLLGDAAHAPLQSFAQGAGMAIEDGLCLGECIHANDDYPAAFQAFEKFRLLRTARLQLESRSLWEFYHCGGIARDVRNQTVADWDEAHLFACLAWLYDGAALPA